MGFVFSQIGQEIEVRPGIVSKTAEGIQCQPILSRIISLFTEKNELQFAVPGGLIGEERTRGTSEIGRGFGDDVFHCLLPSKVSGPK